jgi:hypothetical protein
MEACRYGTPFSFGTELPQLTRQFGHRAIAIVTQLLQFAATVESQKLSVLTVFGFALK